jgi:hypothetical protein
MTLQHDIENLELQLVDLLKEHAANNEEIVTIKRNNVELRREIQEVQDDLNEAKVSLT